MPDSVWHSRITFNICRVNQNALNALRYKPYKRYERYKPLFNNRTQSQYRKQNRDYHESYAYCHHQYHDWLKKDAFGFAACFFKTNARADLERQRVGINLVMGTIDQADLNTLEHETGQYAVLHGGGKAIPYSGNIFTRNNTAPGLINEL